MTRGPDKHFDRTEVLERALELFWAQGYEATGMTQLVDAMGIGRQSLYNTFGDKKGLFVDAVRHYAMRDIATARQILEAPGSPIANLRRLIEQRTQMLQEADQRGCFIGNSLAEFGRRDERVQNLLGKCLVTMRDLVRDALRRAQEAGEISSQLDAADLAEMLLVNLQGLALLSKMQPGTIHADRIVRTLLAMVGAS